MCPVDDAVASGDVAVLYATRSAATDECTLCETVTGFVQGYLYANHTEQEIQEGLDALCSLLPDSQQCTAMVDQYLAAIYMFLRSVERNETKPHRANRMRPHDDHSYLYCVVLWCPGRTPTRTSCAQSSSCAVRSELHSDYVYLRRVFFPIDCRRTLYTFFQNFKYARSFFRAHSYNSSEKPSRGKFLTNKWASRVYVLCLDQT